MQVVSFSELRKDMRRIMDLVQDRHEPIIVTRKQGNIVLMSLEDYNDLATNYWTERRETFCR